MTHLIAIDQGTTSTRAIVFDAALKPVASASEELRQIYPAPGEVEHDPEEIWAAVVTTVRAAMAKAQVAAKDIAGIGITNQRETTIVWDRATGKPIHNAIVWQDRRTADICERLKRDGHEAAIAAKTGLLLRPVFLRHQDRVAARSCGGRAGGGGRGPAGVRHGRHVPAVAADRRQGARHRRHQCVAHLAVRHPPRGMVRRPASSVRRPAEHAAENGRERRGIRLVGARAVRRRDPHPRHGGRPAGRNHRAGLLFSRNDEGDLRHRVLRAAEHRGPGRRIASSPAHDHRLSA